MTARLERERKLPVTVVAALVAAALVAGIVMVAVAVAWPDPDDHVQDLVVPAPLREVDERVDAVTSDDRFAAPRVPIDGLRDGESRLVEVTGLPRGASLRALVCSAEPVRCGEALPIRSDDAGSAQFLFEFATTVRSGSTAIGSADCTERPCALRIDDADARTVLSVPLVFGARAEAASLRVERASGVRSGDELVAVLAGFAPGTRLTVTLCTPPGPVDPSRCGAPAPEADVVVDHQGRGRAVLDVRPGAVGAHGERCGRGDPCAVAVSGRPDVAVAELTFAGSGSADPGAAQLVVGLLVAAGLCAAAVAVLRRETWTTPDGDPFDGITLDDPFAETPSSTRSR
jgi:hypothetical protein